MLAHLVLAASLQAAPARTSALDALAPLDPWVTVGLQAEGDLDDLLGWFAVMSEARVVVLPGVDGETRLDTPELPWGEVLAALVEDQGLELRLADGDLWIAPGNACRGDGLASVHVVPAFVRPEDLAAALTPEVLGPAGSARAGQDADDDEDQVRAEVEVARLPRALAVIGELDRAQGVARKLAAEIADALGRGDTGPLAAALDLGWAMADRPGECVLDPDVRADADRCADALLSRLGSYTGSRLLAARDGTDGTRALVRVHAEPGARLDYLDLLLRPTCHGIGIEVADVFWFGTAEDWSRVCRAFVLGRDPRGGNPPGWERLPELWKLGVPDPGAAVAGWQALPEEVRRDPLVRRRYVPLAAMLGREARERALEELRGQQPDDPALDLLDVFPGETPEHEARALAALDRLERRTGDHAFLEAVRATVAMDHGRPERARLHARAAVAGEPGLYLAHNLLLLAAAALGDRAEALREVETLVRRFDADLAGLESDPRYAAVAGWPEYRAWKEREGGEKP
jgi:hypothetical protein